VEELIAALQGGPDPQVREQVSELIQTLLDLHGNGIERISSVVFDSGAEGAALLDQLGQDRLVSGLLLLHGLHPIDLEARLSA
jgi:hypothetical protein